MVVEFFAHWIDAGEFGGLFLRPLRVAVSVAMHDAGTDRRRVVPPGSGDKRVDIPIRYSTAFGWSFNDDWSLHYNYLYKVNVSTKSPYYKTVTGIQLKGGF